MYREHDIDHVVEINNVWPKIRKTLTWFNENPGKFILSDRQKTEAYIAWVNQGNTPTPREE